MDQCIVKSVDQVSGKVVETATLKCIPCLIENVVNFGLILSGIVAALFIVISGIKFVMSGGDQQRVAQARRTMTYALIGLVIVVLSYSIINFAASAFGITIFTQCGPS